MYFANFNEKKSRVEGLIKLQWQFG